jgi:hypothetical protein
MKSAAIILLLAGAAACGASSAPPAKTAAHDGIAAEQPKDEATRALSEDECRGLGQSIIEACHGTNTRSAQFEGWCGDVVHGVDSGTWTEDCVKHMKYMDAVCITSNTSIRSMMDCDSAVQR